MLKRARVLVAALPIALLTLSGCAASYSQDQRVSNLILCERNPSMAGASSMDDLPTCLHGLMPDLSDDQINHVIDMGENGQSAGDMVGDR